MSGTPLLDADGTASMATMFMLSHLGLRRDLARFRHALEQPRPGDAALLLAAWGEFHGTLHGHHEAEDQRLFPHLLQHVPALRTVVERLADDHRRIDPLLARGDAAFGGLEGKRHEALAIVSELEALLGPHLALEEAEVIPQLREVKAFPPPPSEEEAALYAQGFGWSSYGVAPEVLEEVDAMLPEILRSRVGAAREAFAAKFRSTWGLELAASSRRSIPG